MTEEQETIVRAAIHHNGKTYSVPRPGRHHEVCREVWEAMGTPGHLHEQGFVTSTGRFVDRLEACLIAQAAGQIRNKTYPLEQLFSEDLW